MVLVSALLVAFLTAAPTYLVAQPCNITDASGCDCPDGSNDCDLLPDITAAKILLEDPSQNTETPGELGVSVSTPNIGHGPLRIIPTDYFLCDGDTIFSPGGYSGSCPSGSEPRQLIYQRIYHKNPDGSMTYNDRWAGSMTYHESHGHMHVDDWGVYSLRTPVPGVTDPLAWPIVGDGAKLGFCLMDFGSCASYAGHCVDTNGVVLLDDAPNVGLGGGSYSCGTSNQGITAGYTDIYSQYLDGMQIAIPASACNGDYKVVVHVDPNDYFLEEHEGNNVQVVDITLTQQGGGDVSILADGPTTFCDGSMVTLSLDASATSYSWSTGETTSSITVDATEMGITCTANTVCGLLTTDTVDVTVNTAAAPTTSGDTVCGSGTATLTASASGTLRWFDAPTGGTELATGASYTTPVISSTTTYYVSNEEGALGAINYVGETGHTGTSIYHGSTGEYGLIFDALADFELVSVQVETDFAGDREIILENAGGTVIASKLVNIPVGISRVDLNFNVPAGTDYELATNVSVNLSTLGNNSPELKRTNGGTSYPYVIADVVSINTSPVGDSYYYYFYDWEVKEPDFLCASDRIPVEATVNPSCGDCLTPANPVSSAVTASSANVSWDGSTVDAYQIYGRKLGSTSWKKVIVTESTYDVTIVQPSTTYEWKVRARCLDGSITPFSALDVFTTPSSRFVPMALDVYPNPTRSQFFVTMTGEAREVNLVVEDLLGRVVADLGSRYMEKGVPVEVNEDLNSGIYFVKASSNTLNGLESDQEVIRVVITE